MVGLIRARVARFHPSMWLDGVIGALGTTALGVAFLIGPYLPPPAVSRPSPLMELALPAPTSCCSPCWSRWARSSAFASTARCSRSSRALLHPSPATSCSSPVRRRHLRRRQPDRPDLAHRHLPASPSPRTAPAIRCRSPPRSSRAAPAPAGGCSPCRWPATSPASSSSPSGWGDPLPSAAAWLAIGCVLAALARTAVTLREVRSFHEVKQQARTDELTGLPNRRALLEPPAGCWPRRSPAARGPAAARPRRVQGGQRQPRPPRRRPAAAPGRPAAGARAAPPATCWPASAATSSPSCCRTRRSTRPRTAPSGCAS